MPCQHRRGSSRPSRRCPRVCPLMQRPERVLWIRCAMRRSPIQCPRRVLPSQTRPQRACQVQGRRLSFSAPSCRRRHARHRRSRKPRPCRPWRARCSYRVCQSTRRKRLVQSRTRRTSTGCPRLTLRRSRTTCLGVQSTQTACQARRAPCTVPFSQACRARPCTLAISA